MTPSSPILWLIRMYRRWLSPLKGWKCAHGQEHGKNTCSQMGLRIFTKTTNPLKGAILLQRQFDRCADSAERLQPLTTFTGTAKPFTRLLQSQRGDCDPGCDAGGCDVPDCGKCEMPALSCPFSDPNPRSARFCDWSLCCDGPNCDTNKKSNSPKQQSKLAAKRQISKEKRTERRLAAHEARERRRAARKTRGDGQQEHESGNDDD